MAKKDFNKRIIINVNLSGEKLSFTIDIPKFIDGYAAATFEHDNVYYSFILNDKYEMVTPLIKFINPSHAIRLFKNNKFICGDCDGVEEWFYLLDLNTDCFTVNNGILTETKPLLMFEEYVALDDKVAVIKRSGEISLYNVSNNKRLSINYDCLIESESKDYLVGILYAANAINDDYIIIKCPVFKDGMISDFLLINNKMVHYSDDVLQEAFSQGAPAVMALAVESYHEMHKETGTYKCLTS